MLPIARAKQKYQSYYLSGMKALCLTLWEFPEIHVVNLRTSPIIHRVHLLGAASTILLNFFFVYFCPICIRILPCVYYIRLVNKLLMIRDLEDVRRQRPIIIFEILVIPIDTAVTLFTNAKVCACLAHILESMDLLQVEAQA